MVSAKRHLPRLRMLITPALQALIMGGLLLWLDWHGRVPATREDLGVVVSGLYLAITVGETQLFSDIQFTWSILMKRWKNELNATNPSGANTPTDR